MSRTESDREDFLREATALVERAELLIPGLDEPVVVGFRRDGAASFFFGADPVYQFNAAGELRRGFAEGLLYKAEEGRLVALRRERSATETALVRHELSPDESAAFLATLRQQLDRLHGALGRGDYQLHGQVSGTSDLPKRIAAWIRELPAAIPIAKRPGAR